VPADGGATGSPGAAPAATDTGGVAQPPRSSRSDEGGAGARDNPAEPSRTTPFTGPGKIPMGVNFGPGIEFQTLNEEYLFQIHNQTQIEGRLAHVGELVELERRRASAPAGSHQKTDISRNSDKNRC
jgi:hypothetical protein